MHLCQIHRLSGRGSVVSIGYMEITGSRCVNGRNSGSIMCVDCWNSGSTTSWVGGSRCVNGKRNGSIMCIGGRNGGAGYVITSCNDVNGYDWYETVLISTRMIHTICPTLIEVDKKYKVVTKTTVYWYILKRKIKQSTNINRINQQMNTSS